VFANITLTAILTLVCAVLLSDLFAFWHDRTTFGNVTMIAAVAFTIGWFFVGIKGAW